MPVKTGMSTYPFGRPCSECGTDFFFIDWCLVCRYTDAWGLSPEWILFWGVHLVILAWALEFEGNRYKRIRQLVKTLRPKMPGFHKFRSDYRLRAWLLLIQTLVDILIQIYCVDWISNKDTPIWTARWIFTIVFFMYTAHMRVFLSRPSFYCQDPAKGQQSISADSANGPFYLYRDNGWKRYPALEALVQSLDVKPKSQ